MRDPKLEGELAASAKVVGAPWAKSPYYDSAEQFTHIFWNPAGRFRPLFDKMDLTAVLELSCGHGRHAEKVATMTQNLTLIDIFDANLDFCRGRLRAYPHIRYIKGNGYSLEPIESDSITAIYCYDSMVHFSPDLVENYLKEVSRVLQAGGMALFHHSNYAAPLDRHYGQNPHARNHMTKALFEAYSQQAGLKVVQSNVMSWGGVVDIDCITLVCA
jgi:ubiquinone/menaquinone biosynthesis C-methylase UbiE